MKTETIGRGTDMTDYQDFLNSVTLSQWQRLGLQRRAGVAVPLFSVYSKKSIGTGEIPDLNLLVDWCARTSMSIIQLLPMNDVGFDFRPYDAQSTFALEPLFLSLEALQGVDAASTRKAVRHLREQFPAGRGRVDYKAKSAKLKFLWEVFSGLKPRSLGKDFDAYCEKNRYWLEDYALFRVFKDTHSGSGWESWPEPYRSREAATLEKFKKDNAQALLFQKWLQWQLCRQFIRAREYAASKKVTLMGDLPFLVSRDSADVWARQHYFKLDLLSGAPPDAFFAMGQRWGMPPYNWPAIAADRHEYLVRKLQYAEQFYDSYRIDHVVGCFRVWTIPAAEPPETQGLNGRFDPADESQWEAQGRTLLSVMISNTNMLPCAEDLGVIPLCCTRVLEEYAVPGMDVQRWTKHWETTGDFKKPEAYRRKSIAVISNHDMPSFQGWWQHMADTVDEELFRRACEQKGIRFEAVKDALFDYRLAHEGRVPWRPEINTPAALAGALQRPEHEIFDLAQTHRGSYGERKKFWEFAGLRGQPSKNISPKLVEAALAGASKTSAIFSVQLLQDLLCLDKRFQNPSWDYRINFPGVNSDRNWSLVMPLSLEDMNELKINQALSKLHRLGRRI